MSSSYNNKIHQTGRFRSIEGPVVGTILPGMLVEQAAGGFQAHSTAGGFAEVMFAQEDALQGGTVLGYQGSTGSFTGYTVAGKDGFGPDQVFLYNEAPGSVGLALLKAGFAYTVGMKLISDGAGKLKPTTGTPSQIIAVVTVALNIAATGAVDTLSQVRVL